MTPSKNEMDTSFQTEVKRLITNLSYISNSEAMARLDHETRSELHDVAENLMCAINQWNESS